MSKKHSRAAISILIFLILVIVVVNLFKVLRTSVSLAILRDNANFYNEWSVQTEEITEKYNLNEQERQKFYNSEDEVIKFYSNQNILGKCLIITIYVAIIAVLVKLLVKILEFWAIHHCIKAFKKYKYQRNNKPRRAINCQRPRRVS